MSFGARLSNVFARVIISVFSGELVKSVMCGTTKYNNAPIAIITGIALTSSSRAISIALLFMC